MASWLSERSSSTGPPELRFRVPSGAQETNEPGLSGLPDCQLPLGEGRAVPVEEQHLRDLARGAGRRRRPPAASRRVTRPASAGSTPISSVTAGAATTVDRRDDHHRAAAGGDVPTVGADPGVGADRDLLRLPARRSGSGRCARRPARSTSRSRPSWPSGERSTLSMKYGPPSSTSLEALGSPTKYSSCCCRRLEVDGHEPAVLAHEGDEGRSLAERRGIDRFAQAADVVEAVDAREVGEVRARPRSRRRRRRGPRRTRRAGRCPRCSRRASASWYSSTASRTASASR